MKDIHHVIKHAKFGDDRLRGSGVVAGQISAFPIDFAGRPYNTLTLPCERVIIDSILFIQFICLTVLFDNLSPGPLWSSSCSWTLYFILHAFLHPIIILISQLSSCPYHRSLFCCNTNLHLISLSAPYLEICLLA